jgi:hypothetical protein
MEFEMWARLINYLVGILVGYSFGRRYREKKPAEKGSH